MIRPKMRPSLSRKVKYWGIAPTAHKKLGREARRGSHDLRRLVGHANFLDVLASELDVSDEEDIIAPAQQQPNEEEVKRSDDEDTASDSWSECDDSSDDDDHALMRTISGHLFKNQIEVREAAEGIAEPMIASAGDYFQVEHMGPIVVAIGDVVELEHGGEKKEEISVTVTSVALTPLASPTEA